MAEILTTPGNMIVKTYEVKELYLNWDSKLVRVGLQDSLGARPKFEFTGDEAQTLMSTLNTANLTNNSLHKRILTYLTNQGYLTGSIAGIPA